MNVLLDTHVAIWALGNPERLPGSIREFISDEGNEVWVSDISIWEVAIKHSKKPGKIPFSGAEFAAYCDKAGYRALSVTRRAILLYEGLDTARAEGIHADPFDRMLIAQSKDLNALLLTHDSNMRLYDEPTVVVF